MMDIAFVNSQVGLPTEMASGACYLQFYIEYIISLQYKYAENSLNDEVTDLPLCIMTSGDTNQRTIELLEKNKYFGMQKSQTTIVQQGAGVPALIDNDANIALDTKDPFKVLTKPHGHGDTHELLYRHGVARKWAEKGLKWLVMFQDTNGLAFHTLPLMLGVSSKIGLVMNSLAVPRKAKQAIGGIAQLYKKETGETRCVENV